MDTRAAVVATLVVLVSAVVGVAGVGGAFLLIYLFKEHAVWVGLGLFVAVVLVTCWLGVYFNERDRWRP